jgi:2,3-dihydroxy-p-cumate/2,3-dihydroxybenzoate 3,4-dioxygenase
VIRYKKLGYVALNVTDIESSSRFYEHIVGLQPVNKPDGPGPVFFRFMEEHHQLVLYPGEAPGLKRVGLEVEDGEQLQIAFEHLTKAGVNPVEVGQDELKTLHQRQSFRFQEPHSGIWFELYNEMMVLGEKVTSKLTQIEKLGHVVVSIKKYNEALKFMTETMNFKVSDYFGDKFAFMRCFPNPNHHSFAISEGNENKLNHVNFMVKDINDIGIAKNRMLNNEVPIVFGPGRHFPSESIFLYFLDPDGMTVEYSFGMEQFAEGDSRKSRYLELSKAIGDTWGGKRDPRMGAVGKIEGAE